MKVRRSGETPSERFERVASAAVARYERAKRKRESQLKEESATYSRESRESSV